MRPSLCRFMGAHQYVGACCNTACHVVLVTAVTVGTVWEMLVELVCARLKSALNAHLTMPCTAQVRVERCPSAKAYMGLHTSLGDL